MDKRMVYAVREFPGGRFATIGAEVISETWNGWMRLRLSDGEVVNRRISADGWRATIHDAWVYAIERASWWLSIMAFAQDPDKINDEGAYKVRLEAVNKILAVAQCAMGEHHKLGHLLGEIEGYQRTISNQNGREA